MFGFFRKTDRYSELYDHLVSRWRMQPGFASAFLNEYRSSLSRQYEKGLVFHRQGIMSQSGDNLELIFISLRDTTLVSQAYLAYMHDLRSGRYAGTNIEKAIWAILISHRHIVETHNSGFVKYLLDNVGVMFPDLMSCVFNDPLGLLAGEVCAATNNASIPHSKTNESDFAKEVFDTAQRKSKPVRSAPIELSIQTKICCHCGGKIRIDSEVCGCPGCGLDPDQEIMGRYGITFEGGRYKFLHHYFSKRIDAINFAKMKLKNI